MEKKLIIVFQREFAEESIKERTLPSSGERQRNLERNDEPCGSGVLWSSRSERTVRITRLLSARTEPMVKPHHPGRGARSAGPDDE
jgi:hypothetical protein